MDAPWRVEVYVHADLACFIAPRRRPAAHAPLQLDWRPQDRLKHRIEALGIPHTEVGAIRSAQGAHRWDWMPGPGTTVHLDCYPGADAAARALLHDPLSLPPRFAADAHLGRLAGYLRLFGFDTLLPPEAGDAALAQRAAREGRVLLTRDRSLLMHRVVRHGAYVRAQRPRAQLQEVLMRYALVDAAAPFTRCLRCNGVLDTAAKEAVAARLPPRVAARHTRYMRCAGCGCVYWPGSHYQRLAALVAEVRRRVTEAR